MVAVDAVSVLIWDDLWTFTVEVVDGEIATFSQPVVGCVDDVKQVGSIDEV